jgi:hypothetical protein
VTIRTQVDNKDLALKPQMLATMKIQGAMEKTLAIPALAVVRENDKDYVYVKKAENHYRLTPVELGRPAVVCDLWSRGERRHADRGRRCIPPEQ